MGFFFDISQPDYHEIFGIHDNFVHDYDYEYRLKKSIKVDYTSVNLIIN